MVRLTKIYTRTGDDGTTGLGDGKRLSKAAPRVEAYGTVDEANASIGLAVCEADRAGPAGASIGSALRSIQHDLFDVGADLCTPIEGAEKPGAKLRVLAAQTGRLEPLIDQFNEGLGPLTSFVLPGGTPLAAALHLARTVTRRAERLTVLLREQEPEVTSGEPVRYLNRLSDLLFVLARAANRAAGGPGDVLWKPGANRGA